MEGNKHFSHPHTLTYHQTQSSEDAQLTCTGCNLLCTDNPVYSCPKCKFFLHGQCFEATRSLTHPSHPSHPLSLFPSPTYPSGVFICKSCNKTGSGLCYGCSACDFDLHIRCAYNTLNSKPNPNPPPNHIKLKSHTIHPLKRYPKPPNSIGARLCNVCGSPCDPNSALYRCDICDYDAHVACTNLPENVQREHHEHVLSLLHVNPHRQFECDVCRHAIAQNNCMYVCSSGCGYGTHVKCALSKVSNQAPMEDDTFECETNPLIWALAAAIVILAVGFAANLQ